MVKSFLKFVGITMVTMEVTYLFAGLIARFPLGGAAFYPPSPTAISYLRDPAAPGMAPLFLGGGLLRGLLFGAALFPLRKAFTGMGTWLGGLSFAAVIFIVGYVAASGGMIEHLVWFNEYPAQFAAITFVEILIQSLIMGPWTVSWAKRAQV
jgi:hypothetical protein